MRKLLLATALITVLGGSVQAQDAGVTLRSGQHDSHTRLVFDWPSSTSYTVTRANDGTLTVRFGTSASLNVSGFSADGVVTDISQSQDANGLSVSFGTAKETTYRHFLIGNRVVIDVFPASENRNAAKKVQTSASSPQESKQERKVTAEPVEEEQEAKTEATSLAEPTVAAAPAETVEKTIIEQAQAGIEAHAISISATKKFGLAAFEWNGWLWLVADEPDVTVPPQVSGSKPELFPPFERTDIAAGGVAWRMKIPAGIEPHLRAEGGGLVWRVIIPTHEKGKPPAKADYQFAAGQTIRGGTVFWPMRLASKILDVKDPLTGQMLKVATVQISDQFAGPAREFVDFRTLNSAVGLAVIPKVDDLQLAKNDNGVFVTRPAGLALSRNDDINRRMMREEVQESAITQDSGAPEGLRRIYDFDKWMLGGIMALSDNEHVLKATMAEKDRDAKVQDLLTLAKMNVANDRGQEALGYLSIAEDELPQLSDNLEYLALRGAAYALSGKYELAWADLNNQALAEFSELKYWQAYTLAWLEDWEQAYARLPKDFTLLLSYPRPLLEKLGVKLAEATLRGGDSKTAKDILLSMQRDKAILRPWTLAGIDYLKGEAHRQNQETEKARELWTELATGHDRFYRTRAGLALTALELQNNEIDPAKAVDRLEGLRYLWRGDELEAQINFNLGKLYLQQDRYVKGFSILRDASTMALPDSDIGREITGYMSSEYRNLLIEDKDLTPLDAATIYEEFKELTPPGDEGNAIIQRLAERLVQADLLTRAASLLQHQVDFRLQGDEKGRVALRLAGIYLLDRNARPALAVLDAARGAFQSSSTLDDAAKMQKIREVDMLQARALSKINRTEEALAILAKFEPREDVHLLRADIAWQAGLWEDAAEALQDLVVDEALDDNRPLTSRQADLLLNRAVALNLSGNRVALANMRTKFEEQMKATTRSRLFEVVTRPRKVSTLSDRETIAAIVSEVDMFKEFLDVYRKDGATLPDSPAPAAVSQ